MTTPKPAKGLVRFLQAIGVSVLALSAVRAPLIVALLARSFSLFPIRHAKYIASWRRPLSRTASRSLWHSRCC
jgi:hypothetical protein